MIDRDGKTLGVGDAVMVPAAPGVGDPADPYTYAPPVSSGVGTIEEIGLISDLMHVPPGSTFECTRCGDSMVARLSSYEGLLFSGCSLVKLDAGDLSERSDEEVMNVFEEARELMRERGSPCLTT